MIDGDYGKRIRNILRLFDDNVRADLMGCSLLVNEVGHLLETHTVRLIGFLFNQISPHGITSLIGAMSPC